MSGRTWLMMVFILAINWGGFVVMLVYSMRREARKARASGEQDE